MSTGTKMLTRCEWAGYDSLARLACDKGQGWCRQELQYCSFTYRRAIEGTEVTCFFCTDNVR